jgi:hypothetical protein
MPPCSPSRASSARRVCARERAERAVDLIGGDVVEAMALDSLLLQPHAARRAQQHMSPDDVGLDESVGAENRAIDMGLRGKVHDRVDALLPQQLLDERTVGDVAVDEAKGRLIIGHAQAGEIACIGERIEHHHTLLRMLLQPVVDEVATDESGSAGHKQARHSSPPARPRAARRANAPSPVRARRAMSCRAR